MPPADVLVTDEGVTVHMDVPGVRPEALEVELEIRHPHRSRRAPVSVRRQRPAVKRVERGFGRFERTLRVSRDLDPNAIEASMTDGVLTLRLPKPESLKPRRIQIQGDDQNREPEGASSA